MKGEINWLKNHWSAGCLVLLMTFIALHINSNSCCLAKGNDTCLQLFLPCFLLARYLRVTCKHHDVLQDVRSQENKSEALVMSEIGGGHSLNQEVGLSRSIHTWWSSHYRTIMHIISMYPTPWSPNKYKKWFVTEGMSRNMCTLLAILAYANELSQDLERVINIFVLQCHLLNWQRVDYNIWGLAGVNNFLQMWHCLATNMALDSFIDL